MYTVEEFKSASSAYGKRLVWRVALVFGLFFLLAIPTTIVTKQYGDDLAEWYVREGGDYRILALIGLALAILIGLVFGPFIGDGRTARRDPRLWCPHCHQLLGTAAATTGKCGRCGRQALVPTERGENPEGNPSITVEEYNKSVSDRYPISVLVHL